MGPGFEYDPGYLYLPERLPDRPGRLGDAVCGPPGRFWIAPELDLAWVSTHPAPTDVRLRIPDPAAPGVTRPALHLPVAGLAPDRFVPAFGMSGGFWWGDTNAHGVDASMLLRDASTTFTGSAPGLAVLFPNGTSRSVPRVVPVAPQSTGTFPATFDTFFATADVNYRHKLFCSENARLDALAGYRYLFLGDELYLGDVPDPGHQEYRLNRAAVANAFNGGQLGLAGEFRMNRWYVAGSAKVALGVVAPEVTATGMFVGAQGRVTGCVFQPLGGLAAAERNTFAVVPTVNVQFGRQLGQHTRLYVAYSFTYLSRAGRLGDALNPLNTGLALTDFWVQAIGFGGEFRF
jgi:hypothetical protein